MSADRGVACSQRQGSWLQRLLALHGLMYGMGRVPEGLLPKTTQLFTSKAVGMATQQQTVEEAELKLNKEKREEESTRKRILLEQEKTRWKLRLEMSLVSCR